MKVCLLKNPSWVVLVATVNAIHVSHVFRITQSHSSQFGAAVQLRRLSVVRLHQSPCGWRLRQLYPAMGASDDVMDAALTIGCPLHSRRAPAGPLTRRTACEDLIMIPQLPWHQGNPIGPILATGTLPLRPIQARRGCLLPAPRTAFIAGVLHQKEAAWTGSHRRESGWAVTDCTTTLGHALHILRSPQVTRGEWQELA
jgi:hypothetical protein